MPKVDYEKQPIKTKLEYTEKGNVKRKQKINKKYYRYMDHFKTLKLAEDSMKLIKKFMDLSSDDLGWIIVDDTKKLSKNPFIIFQEIKK